jgi:Tol biopolymer transport system component
MFTRSTLFSALLTVATLSQAAVPGEVIALYEAHSSRFAVMSPDGSNFAYVPCGGDPTRNGAPRYFLTHRSGGNILRQDAFGNLYNTELTAADEECVQSIVLTNEGNKTLGAGKWSPDGYMIAAEAAEYDLATQTLVRAGIYLADVLYTGDRPTGVTNLRLIIEDGGGFDWSPDSGRIVYPAAGTDGDDLFVYTLATGTTVNITNTPGRSEHWPAWSPAGRIAYSRVSETSRSGDRLDLFSIPDTGGAELRITSKANATSPRNDMACYSPDGQYLSFRSGTYPSERAPLGDMAIYRIKADGTGKASKIVGDKKQTWSLNRWRR